MRGSSRAGLALTPFSWLSTRLVAAASATMTAGQYVHTDGETDSKPPSLPVPGSKQAADIARWGASVKL
jgi:hypothetical protein